MKDDSNVQRKMENLILEYFKESNLIEMANNYQNCINQNQTKRAPLIQMIMKIKRVKNASSFPMKIKKIFSND